VGGEPGGKGRSGVRDPRTDSSPRSRFEVDVSDVKSTMVISGLVMIRSTELSRLRCAMDTK
jgi:hypothetical protein